MKKEHILGVGVHAVTMEEAREQVLNFLNEDTCRMVFTPNPEFIMEAKVNQKFKDILNKGDLVIPDGIGVVIGAKILGTPLKGRVPGFDLIQEVFNAIKGTDKSVYFFGAGPGVAEEAIEKMQEKYPGLKVAGYRNGYFDPEDEEQIVEDINKSGADLLLVGLGAPKQELFMNKYREELKPKVAAGIGGSFDGMAGRVKRAPLFFQKVGLEWFYRLLKQPSRAKRMTRLPLFLVEVMKYRRNKRQ